MIKDLVLPFVPHGENIEVYSPYDQPPSLTIVDTLEAALSQAMAEYRFKAEEILDDHRDKLEEQAASHQLEVAALRAENAKLREKLCIEMDDGQGNILFQSVLPIEQDPKTLKKEVQRDARDDPRKDPRVPVKNASPQTKGAHGQPFMHTMTTMNGGAGGRWEQFVAWVPNGAALQQPCPWKPLSDDTLATAQVEAPVEDKDDQEKRFELLEVWTVSKEEEARAARRKRRMSGDEAKDDVSEYGQENTEDEIFQSGGRDKCTIHPHSNLRISWDLSSLVMTVYDMVMIPMAVFEMPDATFLMFMSWATRLFWTCDMGMSCLTGIVMSNGEVNLMRSYIMRRYLKTWFILDCFIVGIDWGEYIYSQGAAGTGSNVASSSRGLTRTFRIIRVLRLLRLARMKEVVGQITERIQSDKLVYFLQILKLAAMLVSSAHVIACIWWGIGNASDAGWAHKDKYEEKNVGIQYLVSLHWALSQFSGGMDEVAPVGTWERFYAVCIWVLAFMCSAVLLSMLTSSLTQMHIVGGNAARQMATLRKYLKQNQISSNLALRMQRSAQHAISGDLTPDLVELLGVVSEPLRVEMHFEMFSDAFRRHPFFADFIIESPLVMRRVCHYATSTLLMSASDVVFSEGEAPTQPKMYFIIKGDLVYRSEDGENIPVNEGQWLGEGAIWTTWIYKGTLIASGDVKLAMLDAKTFQDLVKRFKDAVSPSFDPKQYAASFVEFLNSKEDANDLSIMKYGV